MNKSSISFFAFFFLLLLLRVWSSSWSLSDFLFVFKVSPISCSISFFSRFDDSLLLFVLSSTISSTISSFFISSCCCLFFSSNLSCLKRISCIVVHLYKKRKRKERERWEKRRNHQKSTNLSSVFLSKKLFILLNWPKIYNKWQILLNIDIIYTYQWSRSIYHPSKYQKWKKEENEIEMKMKTKQMKLEANDIWRCTIKPINYISEHKSPSSIYRYFVILKTIRLKNLFNRQTWANCCWANFIFKITFSLLWMDVKLHLVNHKK